MKAYFLFGFILFLFSCSNDGVNGKLQDSYNLWKSKSAENNHTYAYTVIGGTWAGASWSTTIHVENGEIVKRKFYYTSHSNIPMPENGWGEESIGLILKNYGVNSLEDFKEMMGRELSLEWEESGADLGTHTDTPAAQLLTLDQVYEKAGSEWLNKGKGFKTYLETEHAGLLSLCGYVPDNCADDCFVGIDIRSIVLGN